MWLFLLIVAIVVIVMMIGASSAKNDAAIIQQINALADLMSSETIFREYWRNAHRYFLNSDLPRRVEDEVVTYFFSRHIEIANLFRSIGKDNHKMMVPVLTKRVDLLEDEIAQFIGGSFQAAWSRTSKPVLEKMQKDFLQHHVGLKF